MRAPTFEVRFVLKPTYSLSIVDLVSFGFGYTFLRINFVAVYKLSLILWDLLFLARSICFQRADPPMVPHPRSVGSKRPPDTRVRYVVALNCYPFFVNSCGGFKVAT